MPRVAAGTRTAAGTRSSASGLVFSDSANSFLLKEDGDDILQENSDKIILDGITGGNITVYRSAAGTRSAVV
jgi:hypothetical protein